MEKFSLEKLRDVRLEDRKEIEAFFTAADPVLSDYNFPTLFCWAPCYDLRWCVWRGYLVLYDQKEDYLFQPWGKPVDPPTLFDLSDALRAQGKSGNFFLIVSEFVEAHRADLSSRFDLQLHESLADYVYRTEKLDDLSGPKLRKKKNLISQFTRAWPGHAFADLSEEHIPLCRELAVRWYAEKAHLGKFACEREAIARSLRHFRELKQEGVVLLGEEKLFAFAIYDRMNRNTAVVHFEKSDSEIKGAAQAINRETARRLRGRSELINREQDMGIAGLRQAKRSYDPERIVTPYTLIRKEPKAPFAI
jgi:hypothetical protein